MVRPAAPVRHARRNLTVLTGTAAAVAGLMLYPTSTNRATAGPRTAVTAAPGVVAPGAQPPAAAATPSPVPPPAITTAPSSAPPPRTVAPTAPAQDLVVNGGVAQTQYGPVQVQIRVRGRRIVAAKALVYPQDTGRDRSINGYAIPALDQETVSAQSANIDTVSGATFTSDGYVRSLQAALDAAHLGAGR